VNKKIGILYHKNNNQTVVHVIDRDTLKKTEYYHYTVCGLKKHKIDLAYSFTEKINQIHLTVNSDNSEICLECRKTGNVNVKFLTKFFIKRRDKNE
jgi:hypothetical protein